MENATRRLLAAVRKADDDDKRLAGTLIEEAVEDVRSGGLKGSEEWAGALDLMEDVAVFLYETVGEEEE